MLRSPASPLLRHPPQGQWRHFFSLAVFLPIMLAVLLSKLASQPSCRNTDVDKCFACVGVIVGRVFFFG